MLNLKEHIIALPNESSDIKFINRIKFTSREIDILAAILSGRPAKVIATFLNISPKTIEAHLHNLMLKMKCNSRESIRALLENSDQVAALRLHFINLRLQEIFKRNLNKIRSAIKEKSLSCVLVYSKAAINKETGMCLLKYYTNLQSIFQVLGIQTFLKPIQTNKALIEDIKSHAQKNKADYWSFYFIDNLCLALLEEETTINSISYHKSKFLLLNPASPQQNQASYALTNESTVFDIWWEILAELLPEFDLKDVIREFQIQREELIGEKQEDVKIQNETCNLENNHIQFTPAAVHSELIIPHESILLKRPYLLQQIEDRFKQKNFIQIVVLAGIGGAGKTTTARSYAKTQGRSIIWEINAETHQTLMNSFKNLAYAVADTNLKRETINFIQNIPDEALKEKQTLIFIQNALRAKQEWLLIYDGVTTFESIKDYLPSDHISWGYGNIIITTQNKNIRNMPMIDASNIIKVEALSLSESTELFKRIISKDDKQKAWQLLHQIPENFISQLPPFVLDIALAAYYIKDIQPSYEQYLQQVYQINLSFEQDQHRILKSLGQYNRTRNDHIKYAFTSITQKNVKFKELLLVFCLLNGQKIPKIFLEAYDTNVHIEDLLYLLRQNFLITTGPHPIVNAIYKIEDSTQKIGFRILLNILNVQEVINVITKILKVLKAYKKKHLNEPMVQSYLLSDNVQSVINSIQNIELSSDIKNDFLKELRGVLK